MRRSGNTLLSSAAYSSDRGRGRHPQQSNSLEEAIERYENELLVEALKNSRGNMRQTAGALKTTERIFGYKVKKYGINPRQYR